MRKRENKGMKEEFESRQRDSKSYIAVVFGGENIFQVAGLTNKSCYRRKKNISMRRRRITVEEVKQKGT